jgi:hypothetical protein
VMAEEVVRIAVLAFEDGLDLDSEQSTCHGLGSDHMPGYPRELSTRRLTASIGMRTHSGRWASS